MLRNLEEDYEIVLIVIGFFISIPIIIFCSFLPTEIKNNDYEKIKIIQNKGLLNTNKYIKECLEDGKITVFEDIRIRQKSGNEKEELEKKAKINALKKG